MKPGFLKAWKNEETCFQKHPGVARACFPNVSQFCRPGSIVSRVTKKQNFVSATRQKLFVFPRGKETCFSMFLRFATTGKICYLATSARLLPWFLAKQKTTWPHDLKPARLRNDSPVVKYLSVKANLCSTEIGVLITMGFLDTPGAIISANWRNFATSILIRFLYDAVSSTEISRTICCKCPPFASSSQPRSIRHFFQFSCSSSSRATKTATTLT